MSTAPDNSGSSGQADAVLQPEGQQQLPKEARHKKWHIKKLLSFGGIFICLLLIIAAIGMHLRQKDHLGRLNYEFEMGESQSTEAGEMGLPRRVVAPPAVASLRSKRQEPGDACLDCIADSTTRTELRRIYDYYWKDAVRAVPPHFASQSYESCVSNSECSRELVRGYINLYARDCNQDGVISCRDHIMLHHLGPMQCQASRLQSEEVLERMNECLRQKELE